MLTDEEEKEMLELLEEIEKETATETPENAKP